MYENKHHDELNPNQFAHDLWVTAALFPACISLGVTHEIASTLDVLPTIASLAGAKLPQVMLDGVDMTEIVVKQGKVVASCFTLCRD